MEPKTGMNTDQETLPMYKSSASRKGIAYVFSLIFLAIGLIDLPSGWLFSIPFIFIGGAHIFLLAIYVADIHVYPSFIIISGINRKEEVLWHQISSIQQITYCTRQLWRIRLNQARRSVFFFSAGKGMNDFLKTKVNLVTYP